MRTRLTQKAVLLRVVLGSVIGLLAVTGHAQTDATQLAPEMKKLEGMVGEWQYEGAQFDPPVTGMPYGGAGKYFGTVTNRFVLNGIFLEMRAEEDNPAGKMSIVRMIGYDARAKNYFDRTFDSKGGVSVATATLDGQSYTVDSTLTTPGGTKVLMKIALKYSSDWSRYTALAEASLDGGKTWKPWWKEEGRRVETAVGSSSAEQEVLEAAMGWGRAREKKDIAYIERLLADELTCVHADGTTANKAQLLAVCRSPDYRSVSNVYDLGATVHGDTAIVTGLLTTEQYFRDKDWSQTTRLTETYVKRNGRWQCVATHASQAKGGAREAATRTSAAQLEKNKAVVRRVFDEVFNARNLTVVDELYHKEFLRHAPGGAESTGVQEIGNTVAFLRGMFPDYRENLHEMIAEGDLVACRWTSTGTHADSGKKLDSPCLSVFRFKDGKIVEQWLLWDGDTQKKQLGSN